MVQYTLDSWLANHNIIILIAHCWSVVQTYTQGDRLFVGGGGEGRGGGLKGQTPPLLNNKVCGYLKTPWGPMNLKAGRQDHLDTDERAIKGQQHHILLDQHRIVLASTEP